MPARTIAPTVLPPDSFAARAFAPGQVWEVQSTLPDGSPHSWTVVITTPEVDGDSVSYENPSREQGEGLSMSGLFDGRDGDEEWLLAVELTFRRSGQGDVNVCAVKNPTRSATPDRLAGRMLARSNVDPKTEGDFDALLEPLEAYVKRDDATGLRPCTFSRR